MRPVKVTRGDVLSAARRGGWTHDVAVFDGGDIVRDLFSNDAGVVRAVWIRTPWTSEGRFAGSVFSNKRDRSDRNVWKLSGVGGLINLLSAGGPTS